MTSSKLKPKATTNMPGVDAQQLVDGVKSQKLSEGWIQYEFDKPFTCRSIWIGGNILGAFQAHRMEAQISDDGKTFRSLGRLKTPLHGWQDHGMGVTYTIDPATARFFRFLNDPSGTPVLYENLAGTWGSPKSTFTMNKIELNSAGRINQWEGKAGFTWRRGEWTTRDQVPDEMCVPADRIVDLTGKMDKSGILRWEAPQGQWVVQRFGYTTTGAGTAAAGGGGGLECDKFNAEAARIQFEGWYGEALKRVGADLAGKTLARNHTDSWECRSQNWSPVFRAEFRKRRCYDPVSMLPCMTGVPVGSADRSERFLYDVRLTISELVSDVFFKTTVDLTRQHGSEFSAECSAPTMMSDALAIYRYPDIPMGEFWLNMRAYDKPNDVKDAISGGHIYGKRVIQSEAFTQKPLHWTEDPYWLKPMGDYNFAKGINRFVLHVWAHQAFPDKAPGVTLDAIGTFFGGTQTWYKPGKAWFDYLRRCQAMLQQGLPVVDVCYFVGEEQPSRSILREYLDPGLPTGYEYDCINRDALLTRGCQRRQTGAARRHVVSSAGSARQRSHDAGGGREDRRVGPGRRACDRPQTWPVVQPDRLPA
jgi:hypothetical protein